MRTGTITLSALAVLTPLLASPLLPADYTSARAQSIEIGPGGVRLNPEREVRPEREFRRGPDRRVSEREAVRIAQREGIVDVNRVVRAEREWRISGRDRRGDFARVEIDARSGDVTRLVRGR
jgi:hypothetical protein